MADGEGATHVMSISVRGAANDQEAVIGELESGRGDAVVVVVRLFQDSISGVASDIEIRVSNDDTAIIPDDDTSIVPGDNPSNILSIGSQSVDAVVPGDQDVSVPLESDAVYILRVDRDKAISTTKGGIDVPTG